MQNPAVILDKLCRLIGIPYFEEMLGWERGPKNEDGIWAKYWYDSVHNSTCFLPYKKVNIKLDSDQNDLYQESLPYYEFLTKKSIKI